MTAQTRDAVPPAGAGPFRAREMTISLTVKDLPASAAWYHDVAGFTIDRRIERDGAVRSVALSAGPVRLLLNQDDGKKGWERIKGEGFSLRFLTEQSVDEVAARIKAAGGTLDTEPADMPWGVRMFRVRDPDGYRIAVSSVAG